MFGRIAEAVKRTFGGAEHDLRVGPEGEFRGEVEFQVIVDADDLDGGYIARCVNVPGAVSQGETVEEAVENLGDALSGILAARFDRYFAEHPGVTTDPAWPRPLNIPLNVPVPDTERDKVPA